MNQWKALVALLVVALLSACGQPQNQTTASPAAVPTSPNAAVDTSPAPSSISSSAATTLTDVANEEITTAPETVTVQPDATAGAADPYFNDTDKGTATSGSNTAMGTATGEFNCGDKSKLGTTLALFTWADYWPVEDDNNLLKEFEAACGVQVTLDTFESNEVLAAKLRAGNAGYDIVVPSDYMVDILIRENRLLKLDKSLIPNSANLDPQQMGLYYDPKNEYSLPYQYGMTGIAYNTKSVTPAPTSWAALFDPAKLAPYKNKVSMLDDARESIGAALKFKGFSYNATDAAQLAQAKELLEAQKCDLSRYDSESVSQGLSSGEVVMAHSWDGAAALARSENADIAWIVPQEGGVLWQDNLAVPADAPDPYTAQVFINNVLDGKIGARITDFTYYLTPNKAAAPLVSEEVRNLQYYPDEELRKRLEYIERKGDPGLYDDIWTEIQAKQC